MFADSSQQQTHKLPRIDSPQQQKYPKPNLTIQRNSHIPNNFLRQYFSTTALIGMPDLSIVTFYQKLHKIRSLFIGQLENKQQFMRDNYTMKLPMVVTDLYVPGAYQINKKIQSLKKESFAYIQETINQNFSKIYYGEMIKGKKEGYGVYAEYSTAQKEANFYFYQGFFSQNLRNGVGLQWNRNKVYIGQFLNDSQFSHTKAILLYNSGDLFIGSIFDGKRSGKGAYFVAKQKQNQFYKYQASRKAIDYQSVVVCNWDNDQILFKDNCLMTTGMKQILSMDLKNNESSLLIEQGSIYCGDILQLDEQHRPKIFIRQGKGWQHFLNGDTYRGEYQANKPNGYGHYYWFGGDQYIGQFINGSRNGNGQWIGQNGQKFEGQYRNDRRNGYGIYQWPNGNIYEGEFKDDLRDGLGKMKWQNGEIYMGNWKKGIQHGEGEVRIKVFASNLHKRFTFEHGLPQLSKKKNGKGKLKNQKIEQIAEEEKQKEQTAKSSIQHYGRKNNLGKTKRMSLCQLKTVKNKKISNFSCQQKIKQKEIVHSSFFKVRNRLQTQNNFKSQENSNFCSQKKQIKLQNNERQSSTSDKKNYSKDEMEKQTQHFVRSSHKQKNQHLAPINSMKKHLLKQRQLQNKGKSKLGETLLKPIKWSNFSEAEQHQFY